MASNKYCGRLECQKFGNLRCSQCKSAYYCSNKCQKNDWKKHKKICKSSLIAEEKSSSCCEKQGCYLSGLMRCGRCKSVSYCSKECQTKHWKEHKIDCKPKNEVSSTEEPKKCGEENCQKAGEMNCSRCKSASYCSKDCQKKDWKRHKNNCVTGVSTNDGITDGATNHSKPVTPNKTPFPHNNKDKDDTKDKLNNPQFQNFL